MTRTRTARRRLATLALTAALGLGVSGCGDDAEPADSTDPTASETTSETTPAETPSETASESATPEAQTIDITVSGDTVVPNGERVDATAGEELTLRIAAEVPGEIHVHSTPEQVLTYTAGTTELPLTIDQPGIVEVELHDPALVIVQLEVR